MNRWWFTTHFAFTYLGQVTILAVRHQLAEAMENQGSKYPRATKGDCLWVIRMWVSGMSAPAIAKQMGISVRTVYRKIHRLQTDGIVAPRPYKRRKNNSLPLNINDFNNSTMFRFHIFSLSPFYGRGVAIKSTSL